MNHGTFFVEIKSNPPFCIHNFDSLTQLLLPKVFKDTWSMASKTNCTIKITETHLKQSNVVPIHQKQITFKSQISVPKSGIDILLAQLEKRTDTDDVYEEEICHRAGFWNEQEESKSCS